MSSMISIRMFRELFSGDEEFAVIDPRSEADFAAGHMLAASSLPLDTLAARVAYLLPRRQSLIVLCDNGGGEAEAAAGLLNSYDYPNTAVVEGGLAAWELSGGTVFSGHSVPGKAFGEFVEKSCRTPAIEAAELYRLQQEGVPLLLLDVRSAEEHESFCVPGAVYCAGAELIYRALPLIAPKTRVVVHCGGRTRGIIGAQTLIDAGCDSVEVLENGTMGWQFEGLELEHGNRDLLPDPSSESLILTRAIADRLTQEWHIDRLDSIAAIEKRCRYLIDVRSREEFEAGHVVGSMHVPGGHLLQHVDRYLPVRNSIVVLIDSDWVRAVTTAVWLRRMGWRRVYVHTIDTRHPLLEAGAGIGPVAVEDRSLDPNEFADREALLAANRAYLDWEIALYDQLEGEPAAPYLNA
jgi:rhodanese-related sulfurtransferase